MGYYYESSYFLERKIDELIAKTEKKSLEKEADFVNRLATGVFEGFTVRKSRDPYRYHESKILENKNGNKIKVPVPESKNSNYTHICFEIYNENCSYFLKNREDLPHVVTVIVQNFKSLEEDCLKHQNQLEKKNKIIELSKNSTTTWLTNMFKDSGYTYSIENEKFSTMVMLSVKLKNKTQLNIPIYYKNFQKVMPKLMDYIKEYEKLSENSDFKSTVTNLKKQQSWTKS